MPAGSFDPNDPYSVPPAPPAGWEWRFENGKWTMRRRADNPAPPQDEKDPTLPPDHPDQHPDKPKPPGTGSGNTGPYGPKDGPWDGGGSPKFDWPQFNPPTIEPGTFSFREFEGFDPWVNPTKDDIANEPGYAFARDEGLKAAENSAAARGTLRTGGTIKDLIGWGNSFAEQNASRVFDRKFATWGATNQNKLGAWAANKDLAFGTFDRNELSRFNAFDRNYAGARDAFIFNKFEPAKMTFQDIYNRWKAKGDWLSDAAKGDD